MSGVHLHLILNHVPVFGVFMAVALFAAVLFLRGAVSPRFALSFLVVIAATAVVVYFTGEPAEDAVEKFAGVAKSSIHEHEEAAEITTVALSLLGIFALGVLGLRRSKPIPKWVSAVALVGSLITSALVGWTANLGGQIRHAEIRSGTPSVADSDVDD